MFLFFSVARSQEIGSWERATETAQSTTTANGSAAKPAARAAAAKKGVNPSFGMDMPMMSSAFDTAMWRDAA